MKKQLALVAAIAILAAGCGDRGQDTSNGLGGGNTQSTSGGGGGPAAPGKGDFGDLKDVCSPNEGGGKVASGGDAKETQGISADSIKVSTVADPGFSGSPGLNQEIFDTGDAFMKWCNDAGGINGKKIELTKRDAKLTEYQPVVEAACKSDFALVGDGAVQDNLWATVGVPCGLVDVAGFSVTASKAGKGGDTPMDSRSVQPVPNPSNRHQVGYARLLDKMFPGAADRTGIMYADFQTLIDQKDKVEGGLDASVGNKFIYEATYNITGEANWKPFAQALKNDKVSWFQFIGQPTNGASLDQAMVQVGYQPKVRAFDPNFYDDVYVKTAGSAADGAYVGIAFTPFEEADKSPATKLYLDLIKENGGKKALLGAQSMSGWLLFATLAKTCDKDDNLTRTCILQEAGKVKKWTGGGIHAPTSPATNEPADCTVLLQVKDEKFTRVSPKEGFDCDPSYTAKIKATS